MIRQNSCNKLLYLFALLFFAMLASDLSWAQAPQQDPILAPVQVEIDGKAENSFVEIESSKSSITSLDELRKALQQDAYHEQIKNQSNGPIKSAIKRFAPESLTFFLANGLVITESMLRHGYTDPMSMERHILSLKDPIAHLSFFAFMQANGIFMHQKSKGLVDLDPHTKAQKMRLFSYGGLVWGSLASSLIADVFSPYKPCLDKLFSKDYRFTKFNEEQCKSGLESAFQQWTARKKFSQYAPQIISLVVSQKLSEIADIGVRSGFQKLSKTELIGSFVKSKADKIIFKISAVDVGLILTPGGWTVKSIRWLGKLTQFTAFMAIDHMVSTPLYRAFNNLWKPIAFDFDVLSFNRNWSLADQYNWDITKAESDKLKCPVQNSKCLSFLSFPQKIQSFTQEMQEWRQHLNADNEQNLAGWMELTKKTLNQIELSYSYYKSFANNLFDALNVGQQLQNKEDINVKVMPLFPFRTFPLFGITFETKSDVSLADQYLLSPQHLEKYQLQKIYETVIKFSPAITTLSSKRSQIFLQNTFLKLSTTDLSTVAAGLQDLNKISGYYGREVIEKTLNGSDQQLTELTKKIRTELGNPDPKLYRGEGFSKAFSMNSAYLETSREANFKWSGRTYSFKNDGDFFMYQMLCGPQKGQLTDNLVFTDNFIPPSMLKQAAKPSVCGSLGTYITSNSLYNLNIDGKYQIIDYLIQNLDYNILGDYRNKETKNQFDIWWQQNIKASIQTRFADFDKRYQQLVDKTYKRIFSPTKVIDKLNQGRYLPKTIFESFQWEIQVYTNILNSLSSSNTEIKDINYLEAVKNSKSIYPKKIESISKLQQLYVSYMDLLKQKEMTFDQYSEIKTEIDETLELIKNSVQIKNKIQEESLTKTLIGLSSVESDIRRFLRMKILLSQTLELDLKEFIADVNSQKAVKPQSMNSMNPRGN